MDFINYGRMFRACLGQPGCAGEWTLSWYHCRVYLFIQPPIPKHALASLALPVNGPPCEQCAKYFKYNQSSACDKHYYISQSLGPGLQPPFSRAMPWVWQESWKDGWQDRWRDEGSRWQDWHGWQDSYRSVNRSINLIHITL